MKNGDSPLYGFLTGAKGVKIAMVIVLFVLGGAWMQHAYGEDAVEVVAETAEEKQLTEEVAESEVTNPWDKLRSYFTDKDEVEARLSELREMERQLDERAEQLNQLEERLEFRDQELVVKQRAHRELLRQVLDCTSPVLQAMEEDASATE